MSSAIRKFLLAGGALLLTGALAACGGGGGDGGGASEEGASEGTTVKVTMTETDEVWAFEIDRMTVPAGMVTFQVINDGKFEHELMVYPAQDLAHMLEDMVIAEMGEDAHHGDEISGLVLSVDGHDELELEPGESGTFSVDLSPGTYELGCLIVETVGGQTFTHHEKGMHAALAVQ